MSSESFWALTTKGEDKRKIQFHTNLTRVENGLRDKFNM